MLYNNIYRRKNHSQQCKPCNQEEKMKKILTVIALLSTLIMFGQNPAPFVLKTTLAGEKTSFKPGETISFKMESKCPEGYRLAGWNATAYVRSVPADFAKNLNLKISGKDPKWQTAPFHKWVWYSKGKEKTEDSFKTTEQWPEGDYQISITAIFRVSDKPEVKTDKYRASQIVFTIEK